MRPGCAAWALQGGFAPEHGEDGVDNIAPHLLSTDRGVSAEACAPQAYCLRQHFLPSLPLSLTRLNHPPLTHSLSLSLSLSRALSLSLSISIDPLSPLAPMIVRHSNINPFDGVSGGYNADAQARVAQPAYCRPYHADAGHRSRRPAARDQTRGSVVTVVLHASNLLFFQRVYTLCPKLE